MASHSPAPWHETENDDGDVIVRMDENHFVVIGNLEDTCETCHANAHLIAASPKLLDALRDIESNLVDLQKRPNDYMIIGTALSICRNAIKKATEAQS